MNAFSVQNTGNEMLIKLNRLAFDNTYLMKLIKRLEIEAIAQEAQVSSNINEIANEIDETWWKKNGNDFLKDIKQK